ncbi:MAG: thiol-disulfide oxidoreductase DCC family protein [Bdellovibrionia bacterium]
MDGTVPTQDKKILFFDGVCHLCHWSVDFLISQNRTSGILFAPLQGSTALHLLPAQTVQQMSSLVYWREGQIYTHSTAFIMACADLGSYWKLILVLKWFPLVLRDGVYNIIARHRYQWFGRSEFCRLPKPEERSYFLD